MLEKLCFFSEAHSSFRPSIKFLEKLSARDPPCRHLRSHESQAVEVHVVDFGELGKMLEMSLISELGMVPARTSLAALTFSVSNTYTETAAEWNVPYLSGPQPARQKYGGKRFKKNVLQILNL